MFKAIFFDFDGTLVDSKKAYYLLFQEVLKQNNIKFNKRKLWKELNGQKAEMVFSKVLNEKNEDKIKELCDQLRKKEIEKGIKIVKPIKFSREILILLRRRNKKIYLITNSDKKFVLFLLKKFKFNFDKIFTREYFKEKSKVIVETARSLSLKLSEVLYVGDSILDIEVARKAKCKVAIIPNWSPKYLVKKQKPDFLLNSIKEIIKIV
ncbi:MAG: HAD family hydrolase [Candidatus Micrarchaeia archaeon]